MNLDRDIDKIREEFDVLKYRIYLGTPGSGPVGNYWLRAIHDYFVMQKYDVPDLMRIHVHKAECTRREAAKLINANEKEVTNMYRIMTVSNFLINNVLKWEKEDNVVFSDLDYPSIPFILLKLREKRGVELRRIKNVNGEILMSDLEKNVDDNTKLVCVDRTTPWCGFTYDVKEVCKIAHEHNALVYDDAIQAVGAIDVDVHKDDVDFLTTGSYKWQCGPEGAGIFYIKEDLIEKFDPLFWNYLNVDYPGTCPVLLPSGQDNIESYDYPFINSARKFNLGDCVGEALFGWEATLKFLNNLGIKNIDAKTRRLGEYLIKELQNIGCKVLTPVEPEKRHGLIVYTTGSTKNDVESVNALMNPSIQPKGIKVSTVGIGGIEGIRVGTAFFNTEEDIDTLIKAQKEQLAK